MVSLIDCIYYSWGDLNLTVSTPRALTLTVLTVSMPRNNREKRISSKILMNVVSDFGFFFYGMRFCHEKTARKNGRLGTPHRNPAESLLFLKVLNSRLSLIAANQVLKWLNSIPFCIEFNNWATNDWIWTTLHYLRPCWTNLDQLEPFWDLFWTICDVFWHDFTSSWIVSGSFGSFHNMLVTNLGCLKPFIIVWWLIINYFALF